MNAKVKNGLLMALALCLVLPIAFVFSACGESPATKEEAAAYMAGSYFNYTTQNTDMTKFSDMTIKKTLRQSHDDYVTLTYKKQASDTQTVTEQFTNNETAEETIVAKLQNQTVADNTKIIAAQIVVTSTTTRTTYFVNESDQTLGITTTTLFGTTTYTFGTLGTGAELKYVATRAETVGNSNEPSNVKQEFSSLGAYATAMNELLDDVNLGARQFNPETTQLTYLLSLGTFTKTDHSMKAEFGLTTCDGSGQSARVSSMKAIYQYKDKNLDKLSVATMLRTLNNYESNAYTLSISFGGTQVVVPTGFEDGAFEIPEFDFTASDID